MSFHVSTDMVYQTVVIVRRSAVFGRLMQISTLQQYFNRLQLVFCSCGVLCVDEILFKKLVYLICFCMKAGQEQLSWQTKEETYVQQ